MSRILLPLLALVLLLASCKKDQSRPEPELLGQWNLTKLITRSFDASHVELGSNTVINDNPKYRTHIVMQSTDIEYYYQDTLRTRTPYSRHGTELQYPNNMVAEIMELTDHTLTLGVRNLPIVPSSRVVEQYYTR
jgi:hypothetical protein